MFIGIPTYILLNTTGIHLPARVDYLDLLSITGELLKTIPVKYYPDRKPYGIWNITEFIPPSEAFFLKITGYDKDDYLFQRISSVSFSSIIPGNSFEVYFFSWMIFLIDLVMTRGILNTAHPQPQPKADKTQSLLSWEVTASYCLLY